MPKYRITANVEVEANSPKEATDLVIQSNTDFCLGDAPVQYGDNPVQIKFVGIRKWRKVTA